MILLINVFVVCFISMGFCDDGQELIFVQTVWRHGDRTPTQPFKLDINTNWPQGFGELTERGMHQHINLGKTLRKKYVDTLHFLSPQYKSNEIYVRSTDVNRTLISAISNLIAMYPGAQNESGFTYPNIPEWPRYQIDGKSVGYVPIPIHTVNDFYDYTLNPDMICPRQDQLWKLVEQTPEYTEYSRKNANLIKNVSQITGEEDLTLTSLWVVADALFIEKTWNMTWNTPITEDLFQQINETNDLVEYWNNGLKLKPYKGIDFALELPKIRGGSLLWTLIENMQMKLNCTQSNDAYDYCTFFGPLKYYAYSAHDTTLAALFSVLQFEYTNWNEDGYPHYSSALSIELYKNPDNTNTVKFIYFPLANDNLSHDEDEIDIKPCYGPCTIESLVTNFEKFKPTPNAETLCNTDIVLKDNASPKMNFTVWNFFIIFVFGTFFKICV